MEETGETFICVDVETAGPIPGDYSLLSIGACTIDDPPATFYIELKPINQQVTPESARVHRLSLPRLAQQGVEPRQALQQFEAWLKIQQKEEKNLVFVAFNAAFDWMFVNYYFMHYLGTNPFGHTALDIKALYMGLARTGWAQTAWRFIDPRVKEKEQLTHHALQDALDQAGLFKSLLQQLHKPDTASRR